MSGNGHLALYNLIGRRISFYHKLPRSCKKVLVSGLVSDMVRDIHAGKMVIIFDCNKRVSIDFPRCVVWDGDHNTLTLEYGKADDSEAIADAPPDYDNQDPLASHHFVKIQIDE